MFLNNNYKHLPFICYDIVQRTNGIGELIYYEVRCRFKDDFGYPNFFRLDVMGVDGKAQGYSFYHFETLSQAKQAIEIFEKKLIEQNIKEQVVKTICN